MDKSVLDLEEILGPRDEQLLQTLSTHEPAVGVAPEQWLCCGWYLPLIVFV